MTDPLARSLLTLAAVIGLAGELLAVALMLAAWLLHRPAVPPERYAWLALALTLAAMLAYVLLAGAGWARQGRADRR